jgi:hypothetical protein
VAGRFSTFISDNQKALLEVQAESVPSLWLHLSQSSVMDSFLSSSYLPEEGLLEKMPANISFWWSYLLSRNFSYKANFKKIRLLCKKSDKNNPVFSVKDLPIMEMPEFEVTGATKVELSGLKLFQLPSFLSNLGNLVELNLDGNSLSNARYLCDLYLPN